MYFDKIRILCVAGVIPTAESQFLEDFKATKINCESITKLLKDFPLPTLQPEYPCATEGADTVSSSATELLIWIGAVVCGLDINFMKGQPLVFMYRHLYHPEPHIVCWNGIRTRWTGMVSSKHICTLMEILKYVVQYLSDYFISQFSHCTTLEIHCQNLLSLVTICCRNYVTSTHNHSIPWIAVTIWDLKTHPSLGELMNMGSCYQVTITALYRHIFKPPILVHAKFGYS